MLLVALAFYSEFFFKQVKKCWYIQNDIRSFGGVQILSQTDQKLRSFMFLILRLANSKPKSPSSVFSTSKILKDKKLYDIVLVIKNS